jgi:oxygen-dependent protoporphyrinogen oxidase
VSDDLFDVIVVGGGVAGLSCALRLQQAGLRVRLLEAGGRPGGNVATERIGDFLVELGPHSLMSSGDWVFQLAEELGLGEELTPTRPESGDRFIARDGRIHAMPSGLWSFLTTPLLSLGAKLMLATEPIRIQRGEPTDSAEDFFVRRFGAEAARVLAGAFISGVYAGDPAQLSAPAAFPLFWGFEQAAGSMILGSVPYYRRRAAERAAAGIPVRKGLFSFSGGLGRFPEAEAEALGDAYQGGTSVRSVGRVGEGWEVLTEAGGLRCRAVVLAVPPPDAATVLADADADLAGELAAIPMAPVAVVHLGYLQRQQAIPEGFGFLVPRDEGIRTLGVLFPSRLFDGRAPEGGDLLAGFVGGMKDPAALDLDDEALAAIVLDDLRKLTGLDATPDMVQVLRYRQAIPQLVLGHLERMERVHARRAALPGLFLAGNYTIGVGLKDAVRSGLETATDCGAWLVPHQESSAGGAA